MKTLWSKFPKLPPSKMLLLNGSQALVSIVMVMLVVKIMRHFREWQMVGDGVALLFAGFALASPVYSWLMRRALREQSRELMDGTADILKTTLTRMQEVGLVHPGADLSGLPGKTVPHVGVGVVTETFDPDEPVSPSKAKH